MELAFPKLPRPSTQQSLDLLSKALRQCASYGLTTVQDGATKSVDYQLLSTAAGKRLLTMDVVAYPLWLEAERINDVAAPVSQYVGRLKIGGAKLVLDGSPQGKTAWLTQPYLVPPPGQMPDYRGYPAMSDDEARQWVAKFFAKRWQVLAHTNGDAAAQQFIDAVAQAEDKLGPADRRPVMIHAQTVREDQLDRMKTLGIIPSFFSVHTYFWGDWHRDSVLGPDRAARISPARSAIERSMRFTLHNDAPIVPPDVLRLMWCAVNRTTRSGAVLGADQRIGPLEALRGYVRRRVPEFRGTDQGLDRSRQVGQLRGAIGQPPDRRSRPSGRPDGPGDIRRGAPPIYRRAADQAERK